MLKEFREFALRGNALDLAVGLIIGAAFGAIVSSLVDDIIMPPIGLLLGNVDFSNLFVTLRNGAGPVPEGGYPSLDAARAAGAVTWNVGLFINAVIKFLIVAFAVFLIVKAFNRMRRQFERTEAETTKEAPAAIPPEQVLLSEIRDLLKTQTERGGRSPSTPPTA